MTINKLVRWSEIARYVTATEVERHSGGRVSEPSVRNWLKHGLPRAELMGKSKKVDYLCGALKMRGIDTTPDELRKLSIAHKPKQIKIGFYASLAELDALRGLLSSKISGRGDITQADVFFSRLLTLTEKAKVNYIDDYAIEDSK
jgi:hypothetical protein